MPEREREGDYDSEAWLAAYPLYAASRRDLKEYCAGRVVVSCKTTRPGNTFLLVMALVAEVAGAGTGKGTSDEIVVYSLAAVVYVVARGTLDTGRARQAAAGG